MDDNLTIDKPKDIYLEVDLSVDDIDSYFMVMKDEE